MHSLERHREATPANPAKSISCGFCLSPRSCHGLLAFTLASSPRALSSPLAEASLTGMEKTRVQHLLCTGYRPCTHRVALLHSSVPYEEMPESPAQTTVSAGPQTTYKSCPAIVGCMVAVMFTATEKSSQTRAARESYVNLDKVRKS